MGRGDTRGCEQWVGGDRMEQKCDHERSMG